MKLKLATFSQKEAIWEILQDAIERRKLEGSTQWQDGYPNLDTIISDIENKCGFVMLDGDTVAAYLAIIVNDEPAYKNIEGQWKTNDDFLVIHRVAVASSYIGQGMATKVFRLIEDYSKQQNIYSIKVDTNFDNQPMLRIFEKLGYDYCGKVYLRGAERLAYEKVISK